MTTVSSTCGKEEDTKEDTTDFLLELCLNVIDSSPLPLVATQGPMHIVRYANPAFCLLSGLTQELLLGQPLAETIRGEDRNGCAALLDRVYLTAKAEALADQAHSTQYPGSTYWSYTAWAVLDTDKMPTGVMLQVIDTTDTTSRRRESCDINEAITILAIRQLEQIERAEEGEKRQHQAMRESEHRMKNHLQSICALLDIQTMANDEMVPVSELIQIRSHLRTLALIHDMLTRHTRSEEVAGVLSVRQILQKLIPMLQAVVGVAPIEWSADDCALPIKQGISLAVIINELVTNAVKHGGKHIELKVNASDTSMAVSVCDDGPGFPTGFDPRTDANFGLELLESMARVELRGEISFKNQFEGGACVEIAFPLPDSVEGR